MTICVSRDQIDRLEKAVNINSGTLSASCTGRPIRGG